MASSFPVVAPQAVHKQEYDYIIVGGGTAGCVLANRLSQDPSMKVLVLERGRARTNWTARVPLMSMNFTDKDSPATKWSSLPVKGIIDERRLPIVTGECLGGGSSVNGMIYTRGSALEYDRWSANGRKGWSYRELQPYFKKSEHYIAKSVPDYHGTTGEWINRPVELYYGSTKTLLEACEVHGVHYISDVNAPDAASTGIVKFDVNMDLQSHRVSTFTSFLPPSLVKTRKAYLHICAQAVVTCIDIKPDGNSNMRAVGVSFKNAANSADDGSSTFTAEARKEIILCGGPVGSVQVLQLSGIGPKEVLGSRTKHHLAGVGKNLQDHMGVPLMYSVPTAQSLHVLQKSPLRALWELAVYILLGKGLFTGPVMQLSIFAESRYIDNAGNVLPIDQSAKPGPPDIEIMLIHNNAAEPVVEPANGLMSFLVVNLQPVSTGTVALSSANPQDPPELDLNFLSVPEDFVVLRKGIKLAKRIGEKMCELGCQMADFRLPKSESDEDIDYFVRQYARTTYHYSSTCRMAPEDDARPGVVDDELRVHGFSNLRVADTSILPDILATHLQAPAVLVAEKCADMVLAANKV
ncbi:GMC oxidoreductase [Fistulina hepatica ATCC 64428]|uniref:GMC oxidoreductase n=1 Tax=Fistulina hepatica ATCC 64428 TaxID=1128425 RepID=A0A0D7AQ77_9AGAR|nr:GMC oxidoreductase [Fistulina hepatica ATCC 64428]